MFLVRSELQKDDALQLIQLGKTVLSQLGDNEDAVHTKSLPRPSADQNVSSPTSRLLQRWGRREESALQNHITRREVFLSLFISAMRSDGPSETRNKAESSPQWSFDTSKAQLSAILPWRRLFVAAVDNERVDNESLLSEQPLVLVQSSSSPPSQSSLSDTTFVHFGTEVKHGLFSLFPDGFFLNAGSYGATPLGVIRAAEHLEMKEQQDPNHWEKHRMSLLWEVTQRLASFLHCDPTSLALLSNCNAATSTVLKSVPWESGDKILVLSCEYDATILAAEWLRQFGVLIEVLEVSFPAANEQILADLRTRLLTLQRVAGRDCLPKLANFCHVTSKSAWIFPVKEMIAICHEFGVRVMIDGAHAPGHIPVDISSLDADFYCGTCHKWMFACQGTAFLVAKQEVQCLLDPLVPHCLPAEIRNISSASLRVNDTASDDDNAYHLRFRLSVSPPITATLLSLWTAMDFAENVCGGWEAIREYQLHLAVEASQYLYKEWNLVEEGIELPCIQWSQLRLPLHSERTVHHRQRSRANSVATDDSKVHHGNASDLGEERFSPTLGNCMPLVPIPMSRNATEQDAKKLMGFLLTRYNITCFIAVAPVWAYLKKPRRGAVKSAEEVEDAEEDTSMLGASSRKGYVPMLVIRVTCQIHVSLNDVVVLAAAVKALRMNRISLENSFLPTRLTAKSSKKQLAGTVDDEGDQPESLFRESCLT